MSQVRKYGLYAIFALLWFWGSTRWLTWVEQPSQSDFDRIEIAYRDARIRQLEQQLQPFRFSASFRGEKRLLVCIIVPAHHEQTKCNIE